jgi:hypothetical protein
LLAPLNPEELWKGLEILGASGRHLAADDVGEAGDVDVQGADGVVLGMTDEVGITVGAVGFEGEVEVAVRLRRFRVSIPASDSGEASNASPWSRSSTRMPPPRSRRAAASRARFVWVRLGVTSMSVVTRVEPWRLAA